MNFRVQYLARATTVIALSCVLSCASSLAMAVGDAPAPADPLTAMFAWWNQAIKTPGALTEDAFGRYFTPDGAIVVDGKVFARGLPALVEHFDKIQAAGGSTEIVLPFRKTFRKGDEIYTYHVIRIHRNGTTTCLLAAGDATVRDGKLALVNLVRAKVDPASVPECATPQP